MLFVLIAGALVVVLAVLGLRICRVAALSARVAILVGLGTLLLAGPAHAAAPVAEPAGEASLPASPAEASAPEASAPEVSTPEASASEVSAPEVSAPEASASEVSAPEVSAPEASASEVSTPEVSTPEASAPEVTTPEVSAPEVSAPEVSAPEASAPEVSAPEVSAPVESRKEAKEEPAAESSKEAKEATAVEPVLERGASLSSSLSAASQSAATADNPSNLVAAEVSGAVAGPLTTIFPVTPKRSRRARPMSRLWRGLSPRSAPRTSHASSVDWERSRRTPSRPDLIVPASSRRLSSRSWPRGRRRGKVRPLLAAPAAPPVGTVRSARRPGPHRAGPSAAPAGAAPVSLSPGSRRSRVTCCWGLRCAMRRLRLSFQPWLTAFFVLIPERPG